LGVAVLDTTELRWFAEGSPTPDIESWFTRFDTVGTVEDRCDTYRMDGRRDTGVKHRFRETLELKVRQSTEEPLTLEPGLAGSLEAWRRWSPADGLADRTEHALAVDVCKRVIKRRFSVRGDEIAPGPPIGSGCDVEVATVTVGNVEAWTFAFAAFGPDATRRSALLACWQALVTEMPPPSGFASSFGPSCGYPEWLDLLSVSGTLDTNTGQREALAT
jgi:hypothetical protein